MNYKKKRALRRHHYNRLKVKRRFYWSGDWKALDERQRGLVVDTPCPCSCWMCGNPRRYFGELTIQEKRHDESASYEKAC